MIETTLFDKKGHPAAYISADFRQTIFLWSGIPVAYIYAEEYIYGINGLHLGWFRDGILFNNSGERIGFTFSNCPVAVAKVPAKGKKQAVEKVRPRWHAQSHPKFLVNFADQDLEDFLSEGLVSRLEERDPLKNIWIEEP